MSSRYFYRKSIAPVVFSLFCLSLLFTITPAKAQFCGDLDSLLTELEKPYHDTVVIELFLEIGDCYYFNDPEIIKMLSDGLSGKEIASRLYVSARTVESHKANILGKLNLNNNADLIKYAIKQGIVKL